MTRSNMAILILLGTMVVSPGAAQAVDAIAEIEACASIKDGDARLACFDELGERVRKQEPAQPVVDPPVQEAAAETESPGMTNAQPLPDELGKAETAQYVGLITSCRQGGSGTWYFFFDNGQVWKEVNKRNRRFKDCNSRVTITKDAFGYKMQIDGVKRTVRVQRHR